ncbi:hypothetical protein BGZ63DRAFT_395695 [Mariannaea sp. PMI_226]|nr:hypothetical protein BGZ63DRAFT_395695 [Mariannaea sp. PMI_226]
MHQKDEEAPLNSALDRSDSEEELAEPYGFVPSKEPHRSWGGRLGQVVGLIGIVLLSGGLGAWLSHGHLDLDRKCAAHTTQWSPVLKDVAIKYAIQSFDGRFMDENVFRKNASKEVDAAWESLGVDYRAGVISYEDGLKSGLDDSFVQRNEKYGGGFIVNVEGMHHLHCLNLLRKSLYFNYPYYKKLGAHAFKNDDRILQLHVTHCLDTIRQVLMCNVDTGVLGQVWADPDEPTAFPDFNTRHMCKNYDDVRKWAEKLQAPPNGQVPKDFVANPHDGDVLPSTP